MSFKNKLSKLFNDFLITMIAIFMVLIIVTFCSSCDRFKEEPKPECTKPQNMIVFQVGGCDSSGRCGVLLVNPDTSYETHAVMRYPINGATVFGYVRCLVPGENPSWWQLK